MRMRKKNRNFGIATVHGHTTGAKISGTYRSWIAMRNRCKYPNDASYERYGGRGISVCDRWAIFANFLSDMGERPSGTTLDRINNQGNYEPGNCRWATLLERARNKRSTRTITISGTTKCLVDWCQEFQISHTTVLQRERYGWSIERSITTPVGKWSRRIA